MTKVDTSKQRVKNTIPCTATPSHEFIIIAFYYEGAGLMTVPWVVRNIIYLKFQNQFNLLFEMCKLYQKETYIRILTFIVNFYKRYFKQV